MATNHRMLLSLFLFLIGLGLVMFAVSLVVLFSVEGIPFNFENLLAWAGMGLANIAMLVALLTIGMAIPIAIIVAAGINRKREERS